MRIRTTTALLTTALTLTAGTTAVAAGATDRAPATAVEQAATDTAPTSAGAGTDVHRASAARLGSALLDALEREDLAAIDRLIADDIVLTQPFALEATRDEAPTYTGRDEVLAFFEQIFGLFDQTAVDIERITPARGGATAFVEYGGDFVTSAGSGLPVGGGQPYQNRYVSAIVVDDGQIVQIREYFSPAIVARQLLGITIPTPGGTTND